MKHTPGPWQWSNRNGEGWGNSGVYGGLYAAHDKCVLDSCGEHSDSIVSIESEADAKLIAAAPELAETLRDIIHDYKTETYLVRISDESMARLVAAEELLRKAGLL